MGSFIKQVLEDVLSKHDNVSKLTFILPSKRAGVFLRNELLSLVTKTIFAPSIISIEEFVQEVSQLKQITNIELLFELYKSYASLTSEENQVESFDTFSKWAQVLLQDFNEIDRYLIPPKNVFDYISAIQDIDHWSVSDEGQTPLIQNYLSFWKQLHKLYNTYTNTLLQKEVAYQGLIYREATKNIDSYLEFNQKHHIFLGFNALNSCETLIIQELLKNNCADIYWDIDSSFVVNEIHQAGYFIRHYKKHWKYYSAHTLKWLHNLYQQPKDISIIGVPKNIGQAKYVGSLLNELKSTNGHLNNTAVVLSDEALLTPVLTSLPEGISGINITMGMPLHSVPLASLFDQLLTLHSQTKKYYYYKDVISIIAHQFIAPLFEGSAQDISEIIHSNNLVFLNIETLIELATDKKELLTLLFKSWQNNPKIAVARCQELIFTIKEHYSDDKEQNSLSLEYLYRFNQLFNTLNEFNTQHQHISTIDGLQNIYSEILSSETLDFQGEPLHGLQIMGMLESRALDFDHVIITSVNEGILPAGKSNNSFIPFDVKLQYSLPTYTEKDAVYTYHFYRLLQRAKKVHILYNTEPDVVNGGEKSRFITQLEIEGLHHITHTIALPETPKIVSKKITIKKTPDVLFKLEKLAEKGFSPSSLTNYIRNPLDFYYQKILGVSRFEEVEETVAANTLGTVVHNTLEDLYKPLEGALLSADIVSAMRPKIEERIRFHFKNIYKEGDISKGKNLIVFEVAKRYVLNFLNSEIELLKQGHTIKILQIECNLKHKTKVENIPFPITLKGKVDRVDEYNGVIRIIDYKTGKVEQNKVEIIDWETLTTDYTKYSKSFQVLMYAYMMYSDNLINSEVEAGIISFKNLQAGFLKFAQKESAKSRIKQHAITSEVLKHFENELHSLLLEIYNPNIDFIEKAI